MKIDLSSNYRQLALRLSTMQKKQLPFAFAQTLNDTAFKVRKQIVERTYPRSFDVRDRRFATQTFRVKKATKRILTAVVFDRLDRANLKLHAEGGTKRAKRGSIAVPSRYVKDRRGARGVRRNLRPREVVDSPKGYISRGKDRAIFQAYGPGGSKKRLLYSLKPSVRIAKVFPFYEDASRTVQRNLQRSFSINFRKALQTARRA